MKRIALLAVIGAGLMALPSSAAAVSDCSFAGGGPVAVYGSAVGGDDGQGNDALIGACVDTNTPADGGYAELGEGAGYGVVDGSDVNPANSAGYVGFDNGGVADASPDANCNGVDEDTGDHNTGGCFWIKPTGTNLTNPVTALFICGSTSGPDYAVSTRDGCAIP